jgi:hypothetical protein
MGALTEQHGDALLHARRLVAQRCVYGVDKNAAAVELAKLSLWLVTLSKELPFTFVDHSLRHGDSLVGLDLEQIRSFHWSPSEQLETCRRALDDALEQALEHRDYILALADKEDPASQREKQRLLEYADLATAQIRMIANVCLGAFFTGETTKEREKERDRRLELVRRMLDGDASVHAELEGLAAEMSRTHMPFHWHLELPEIFYQARPDPLDRGALNRAAYMEAFVGNPPFAGKSSIASFNGAVYPQWLRINYAGDTGVRGSCDMSAYFFRRASSLLGTHGTLGFVATNTIAQGDTHSIGLKHLVREGGFTIYDALTSFSWPGDASVAVAVAHLATGHPSRVVLGQCRLDGTLVEVIDSTLRPRAERADARRLAANAAFVSQGSIPLGVGFVVSPDERAGLVEQSAHNAECIFPYIGGQEINNAPTPRCERHVINFGRMSLEEAAAWPALLEIVRTRVKPEREKQRGGNATSRRRRRIWWQFDGVRADLYAALEDLPRCLVSTAISKHRAFCFAPTGWVFDQRLFVFPLHHFTALAILQSRVHLPWVRRHSSSLGDSETYRGSTCFETFPFPKPDPSEVVDSLEVFGVRFNEVRSTFMVDTNQGLTKTYNELKDPNNDEPFVVDLRRLHEEMDRAVLDAYGWSDIKVPPFCPKTDADRAALQEFEDEVIDRLYVLNAERAAEEERLGLRKKGKKKPVKKKKKTGKRTKSTDSDDQGELF